MPRYLQYSVVVCCGIGVGGNALAPHLPSGDATYCLAKTACPSPATPPVAVHLHFLMFIRMPVNMQKISSPSTTDCADRTSHWYRLTSSAKQVASTATCPPAPSGICTGAIDLRLIVASIQSATAT